MAGRVGPTTGIVRLAMYWALIGSALCVRIASASDPADQPLKPLSLATSSAKSDNPLPEIDWQLVQADAVSFELSRDVGSSLESEPEQLPSAATSMQVIDGRDIACKSAQNWLPAHVLRARARTVIEIYCEEDECTRRAAHTLAVFLNMQANHQEDIGAASALRAYYARIGIQEQLQLCAESLLLVEREDQKQQAMQDGGLAAGTDLSAFQRRRIELRDKQLQLLSQDRQLQSLLAQLTKLTYATHEVQLESLEVFENPLDVERLKQVALQTRHDLRGWTYLAGQVNETSAPVFAKMISTLIGGWGLPLPTISGLKNLLCPPDYSGLAANMRHELWLTVETHRRWISQAVEEKCANLQLAYQRIDLAQQTIAVWETRLAQLERLEGLGDAQPEQIALARVGWLHSRAEEISRRMEARTAEIDLAESVGGLSRRCCCGQPWLLTGFEP